MYLPIEVAVEATARVRLSPSARRNGERRGQYTDNRPNYRSDHGNAVAITGAPAVPAPSNGA